MNALSINKFRATVAACLFALSASAPALHAQWNQGGAKVSVPFAFEVGTTHLPAGQYEIIKINDHILLIRGESARALVMVNHEEGTRPAQRGKLVFAQYGNKFFMRELWKQGSNNYVSCVESKDEDHIRASVATVTHKPADGIQIAVSVLPSF